MWIEKLTILGRRLYSSYFKNVAVSDWSVQLTFLFYFPYIHLSVNFSDNFSRMIIYLILISIYFSFQENVAIVEFGARTQVLHSLSTDYFSIRRKIGELRDCTVHSTFPFPVTSYYTRSVIVEFQTFITYFQRIKNVVLRAI